MAHGPSAAAGSLAFEEICVATLRSAEAHVRRPYFETLQVLRRLPHVDAILRTEGVLALSRREEALATAVIEVHLQA
jgi:hypothetical protein